MMKSFKRTINNTFKVTALILTLLMPVSLTMPAVGLAAAPVVTTDETVYVNMDYYGNLSDVSVVKGCRLNGNIQFEDYGQYKSVVNMSNYATPDLSADGVSWKLNDITDNKPFYFDT